MAQARRQFVQFAAVGAVGFVVDATVLSAIIFLSGASPYSARVGSYLVAATATWWLNRRFTFRDASDLRPLRQWRRFLAANVTGAVVNYVVFATLIGVWPLAPLQPVLAVAAGSAAGLVFNFRVSRALVFSR